MLPGIWCCETAAGRDAIRDVFIFVEDCASLSIEPAGESLPRRRSGPGQPGDSEEKRADRGGRRHYDKPDTSSEHSRCRRQARPVCRSGGRAGHGAGAAQRDGRAPRRSRGEPRLSEEIDRLTVGPARELDEHPHDADTRLPSRSFGGWCTTWRATWARMSSSPSKAPTPNWTKR